MSEKGRGKGEACPEQSRRGGRVRQNHVGAGLTNAAQCADWLRAQGYTVLNVLVGSRNPRIEIAPSRRCAALEGAVFLTERHGGQTARQVWVAHRFGCEVRWEGGAA